MMLLICLHQCFDNCKYFAFIHAYHMINVSEEKSCQLLLLIIKSAFTAQLEYNMYWYIKKTHCVFVYIYICS